MYSYIKKVFSLDYRSLALMRIMVGVTIFLDLIERARSLTAHYTDNGVLPRRELFTIWNENAFWSLYHINGTALFVAVLFIIAGIFALMMVFGHRTKLATIVSFILLISVQSRNPVVLQGGDVALRVILFWMMFLPLDKRFSLDRLLGKTDSAVTKDYFSVASVGYVIQFLLIWFFTGFLKTGAPWISDFSAVGLALTLDEFTRGFGHFLRSLPNLAPVFTIITIAVERYVGILLFMPYKNGKFKLIALFLFNILVIGFNLSFRLGYFGMIMVSISLALLPSEFWNLFSKVQIYLANKSKPGIIVYFDSDCGFCKRVTHAIYKIFLMHPSTQIIKSSQDADAYNLMHAAHSWVVKDANGVSYTGFSGFAVILRNSFFYRIFASIFLLKPIRYIGDKIYRLVADNRAMTCVVHNIEEKNKISYTKLVFYKNIFLIFVIAGSIVWNVHTLPKYQERELNTSYENIMLIFRLDQKWNMFAPYPTNEDGYYVIPGKLRDGSSVNVYTGQTEISYDKPKNMAYTYQDQRWQKYMMNLWQQDFSEYRLGYGQYLCREWNKKNPYEKNLMTFDIVYMLEVTNMNTLKEEEIEPVTIWQHDCFK